MAPWRLSPMGPCFGEEVESVKFAQGMSLPGVISQPYTVHHPDYLLGGQVHHRPIWCLPPSWGVMGAATKKG